MDRTQPRTVVVSIRLTPDEATHLDAAGQALKHPRGRTDFTRAAALHAAKARVPPPSKSVRRPARRMPALDTRLLGQILGQLGKIGGNVNQLARVANSTGAAPADQIAALTEEIAAIRQAVAAVLRGEDQS